MNVSYSSHDVSLLIINLLTYRIFTQIPMLNIQSANTSAPLAALSGGAIWIFVIFLVALSLSKYNGGNILDAAQSAFGTVGKLVIALIFALYLVLSAVFALSDFSKLISLIAFPTSPMWFVTGFLALGGVMGAMGSVRSVARIHGIFVPIILIVFVLLIASTIFPCGNTDIIGNSPQNLTLSFENTLSQITLYGDIILLFLIAPTKESRLIMTKKIGYSCIIALALNVLFYLAFMLKIPASIAQNGQFSVYLLMKEVYFGRFFQRLDAMILLISALTSMLYLSLNLNLLSTVLTQSFRLRQNPIVSVISGILVFYLALNGWIFPKGALSNLIYVFSLGGMAVLIITAIFTKVRGVINEKN